MGSGITTFEMIAELQRLAERAFVYKLRKANPYATDEEIENEVCKWYKLRPGAEHGDAEGRLLDPARFR